MRTVCWAILPRACLPRPRAGPHSSSLARRSKDRSCHRVLQRSRSNSPDRGMPRLLPKIVSRFNGSPTITNRGALSRSKRRFTPRQTRFRSIQQRWAKTAGLSNCGPSNGTPTRRKRSGRRLGSCRRALHRPLLLCEFVKRLRGAGFMLRTGACRVRQSGAARKGHRTLGTTTHFLIGR